MATTVDGSTGVSQIQETVTLKVISTGSVPSLEAKGTSGVTSGYLKLNCSENSHGIKLLGPPHSATADYTLTFPNNDGDADQFLQTNGSGVMTWAAAGGGLTQLASFATTSGTTVASPTLDLSTYKQLIVEFWSCSPDSSEDTSIRWANTGGTAQKLGINGTNISQGYYGRVTHDLVNKYVWTNVFNRDQTDLDGTLFISGAEVTLGVNNQITTATTSLTFDWFSGQDFDGGQIIIYGLN